MARRRTGTTWQHGDHFDCRVTLADGSRSPVIHMADVQAEDAARERAAYYAAEAEAGRLVLDRGGPRETFDAWLSRWTRDRTERGIVSADLDAARLRKWFPFCEKPIASITAGDLETFVETLDRAAAAYAEAERTGQPIDRTRMTSWKSAINLWGIVTNAFKAAKQSKTRALRVRGDNPAEAIPGPDRGDRKARQYLTPAALLAFVKNDAVPVVWRRGVVLAVYLYARAAELRGLRWEDVHIAEGFVVLHRTEDADGNAGSTKTGEPRAVPIEKTLVPLLEAMHREARGLGNVVDLPDDRHLARALRTWLTFAGHEGTELDRTATRAALTWHDLRATGISWRAGRGDDPMRIQVDAGHDDFATTQKYIRRGAIVAGSLEVFPELPAIESSDESSGLSWRKLAAIRNHNRKTVEAQGIEPWSARLQMHPRSRA